MTRGDVKLTASDGFKLGGYRADPAGAPKAAIVVIQEIFGVNHHIRSVCDRLAAAGYVAIAPSIFDRIEPNFQCGYSPDEVANARKFVGNPDWAAMLLDTQAAIDAVKAVGPVGIVGFCLGGSIAYVAATKLSGLSAAVGYYGGAVVRFADDKPKAAIVVIQEIFGVNHHIRSVCDRLAAEGYVAIAPAIFDRIQPDFQCGYSPDEIANARKFIANPDWTAMLRDTQAAIDAVKDVGAVGIIGFCLGGSIAYAAATKLTGLSAAVGYYGGAVVRFADDKPQVPTQLHFGEKDAGIPLTDVETIKSKRPEVEVHIYPGAQHGFHCDERASYDKASSDIAWPRSLEFFAKHLK